MIQSSLFLVRSKNQRRMSLDLLRLKIAMSRVLSQSLFLVAFLAKRLNAKI